MTKRGEIIRTAAKMFASKGYHATTLDEIAKELGITKPSIYYYIKSKEDILREIIGGIMEPLEKVAKLWKLNVKVRRQQHWEISLKLMFRLSGEVIKRNTTEQAGSARGN